MGGGVCAPLPRGEGADSVYRSCCVRTPLSGDRFCFDLYYEARVG